MNTFTINVSQIEELQTIKDLEELDRIFQRARSTVVQGEKVELIRSHQDGRNDKFDELTTEDDLERYRQDVFKYL